jgi:uncharacterized membrane protein YfcA
MAETATLALTLAALALAGLVHGVLGMGFPMVATPLLALQGDLRQAVIATLLPTIAVNVVNVARGGRWTHSIGTHWPLILLVPVGTIAGTLLLLSVDPVPLQLVLAAVIVLYLVQARLPPGLFGWIQARPRLAYAVFGLGAGLLAGTVNVMVPLLVIFCLELGMGKLVMIQVLNLCFLTGKLVQMATFGAVGTLGAADLVTYLPHTAVALAALALGIRVRDRLAGETYIRWVRRALVAIAVALSAQVVMTLSVGT